MRFKCLIIMIFLCSMVSCDYIRERDYKRSCSFCQKELTEKEYTILIKDSIGLKPSTYYRGSQKNCGTSVLDFSYTPVKSSQYGGTMYIIISNDLKNATLKTGYLVIDNYRIESFHSYYLKSKKGYCVDFYDDKNRPVGQIPQMYDDNRSIWIMRTDKGHIIIRNVMDRYLFKVLSGDKIYHNYRFVGYGSFFDGESLCVDDIEREAIEEFARKNDIPYKIISDFCIRSAERHEIAND